MVHKATIRPKTNLAAPPSFHWLRESPKRPFPFDTKATQRARVQPPPTLYHDREWGATQTCLFPTQQQWFSSVNLLLWRWEKMRRSNDDHHSVFYFGTKSQISTKPNSIRCVRGFTANNRKRCAGSKKKESWWNRKDLTNNNDRKFGNTYTTALFGVYLYGSTPKGLPLFLPYILISRSGLFWM